MAADTTNQLVIHLNRVETLLRELIDEVRTIRGITDEKTTARTNLPPQDQLPTHNAVDISEQTEPAEHLPLSTDPTGVEPTVWEAELVGTDDDIEPEPSVVKADIIALPQTALVISDEDETPDAWMTTAADVLRVLFMAAANPDEEAGFRRFCRTIHSDHARGPRALAELRAFHWRQLRKRYEQYLTDVTQPDSFVISHTVPAVISPVDPLVKVFVASKTRSSVPTVFRRDPQCGGHWRIEVTSL